MSALERHQALVRVHTGEAQPADLAALRAHFQFLRDDAADAARGVVDWRVRLSARYYRRLFREYALADLSRAREGRLGLRWRTAAEVAAGKGQFVCGSTRCDAREALRSYELLFAYAEHGEKKRCLVKVRVCEACAALLFAKKLRQLREEEKEREKKRKKRARAERKEGAFRRAPEKKRRRVAASSASDGSEEEDEDEGAVSDSSSRADGRSVHEVCAELSARDEAARRAGGVGYFEDRSGGHDSEAFQDLLL